MAKQRERPTPMADVLIDVFAIPYNFLSGFFAGLLAPVAAIAVMVAAIRFVTGRVPFLSEIEEDEQGGRSLSFRLLAPEEAKELFEEQKEQIGGEIGKMRDEIEAIVREAREDAVATVEKTVEEVQAEA